MAMPPGAYSSNSSQTNLMAEKRPHGFSKYSVNQYTPEQQRLFRENFQHLGPESYTSRLAMGDESLFAEQEAPALRQFNELQGGLASRFSGQGMGARKSSGFQNTSNAAASDFASQLQANRQELQRQAILDMMGMSDKLLNQRPQERGLVEKPHKETWGDTALKWYQAYQGGNNSGGGAGGLTSMGGSGGGSEAEMAMMFA